MRLRVGSLAVLLISLFSLLSPADLFADTQTFNAMFFKPAIGRNFYLMLDGTQTLNQLQFDVGEVFSFGYHPLQIVQGNTRTAGVIDALLVSDFVASIGALDWLQFGVDMPVVLLNRFADPQATPQPPMKNYFDIGDLRLEAKARVLDSCKGYIGLAFIPFITLPTGKSEHYVGDSGLTGGLKIALDGRVHPNIGLTFNVGYQGGRKVDISNINYQHNLLMGGGIQGIFGHGVTVTGEVNVKAAFNKLFHSRDMNPAEVLVGANWDIKETGVSLFGGGGTCLTCGVGGAKARAVLGVKYRFNPQKMREKEREHNVMCKTQFGGGMSYAELRELAGICPPDPASWQAGVHDAACPKYYELRELAGLVLRCPPTAEQYRPGVDDPGCPKVFDLSSAYSEEEIMNIYTLASMEMSMLCPPNVADFNPQVHDLACPKYYDLMGDLPENVRMAIFDLAQEAGIVGGEIQTIRPVYFDFNKSDIRPDMTPMLDQVIATINANRWIRSIKIGGHADARGTASANELIAQRRSASVVDYMRSHGVRPDVGFQSVSYGSWRPVASNDTEEGRALNRRVVFVIGEREFERGGALPAPKPVPEPSAPAAYAPPAATSPSPSPDAYFPPAATPAAAPAEGEAPAEEEEAPVKAKKPPSRWQ